MKKILFVFIVAIALFFAGCAGEDVEHAGKSNMADDNFSFIARNDNVNVALISNYISYKTLYFFIHVGHWNSYNIVYKSDISHDYGNGSQGLGLAYVNDTIMVFDGGSLIVSNNNGNTWTKKKIVGIKEGRAFDYDGSVVVVTDYIDDPRPDYDTLDNILVSNDQGNTWKKKFSSNSFYIKNVRVKNGKIIAVGCTSNNITSDGIILISNDNGNTWLYANISIKALFNDVDWFNNNIIVVGSKGQIIVSHDNGNTWSIKSSGVTDDLLCVQYYGSTSIISTGTKKYLLSVDNGDTWTIKTATNSIRRMTYNGTDALTVNNSEVSCLTGTDFIALSTEPSHLHGCEVAGKVITFAQFKPNTLESPLHYCDKNGAIKSIALVKPGTRAGSRFRIKVDPSSEYAKMLLGENNDGILAFQTYVQ